MAVALTRPYPGALSASELTVQGQALPGPMPISIHGRGEVDAQQRER